MNSSIFIKHVEAREQIAERIKNSDKILILGHRNPDLDSHCTQLALATSLRETFPSKSIKALGEQTNYLNQFGLLDEPERLDYEDALVIVVDTATADRVADDRFNSQAQRENIIKIDHHTSGESYAGLEWIATNYSSASEMITDLSRKQDLVVNNKIAELLYLGIIGDTGRMKYTNTSAETYKALAFLARYEFDHSTLINKVEATSITSFQLRAEIATGTTYTKNMVAYATVDQDMINRYGVTPSEAASAVGMYSNVAGLNAWILFIETETGTRARIRSSNESILEIAKQYGGGGHPLAAGMEFNSNSDIKEELIQALDRLFS